jgi:hypothetical protein
MPEPFQEKWNPVFRPKMRQTQNAGAVSVSGQRETALTTFRRKISGVGFRGGIPRLARKCNAGRICVDGHGGE